MHLVTGLMIDSLRSVTRQQGFATITAAGFPTEPAGSRLRDLGRTLSSPLVKNQFVWNWGPYGDPGLLSETVLDFASHQNIVSGSGR